MRKFRKAYNLKILSLAISLLLCTPLVYPLPQERHSLRVPVGQKNTYGTIVGRIKEGPFTYCRISTDDCQGQIVAYLGQGRFTNDPLSTFGGYGVVEIPNLQKLLAYICENGFEHHVAANLAQVADPVAEALSKYLGWQVYYHKG